MERWEGRFCWSECAPAGRHPRSRLCWTHCPKRDLNYSGPRPSRAFHPQDSSCVRSTVLSNSSALSCAPSRRCAASQALGRAAARPAPGGLRVAKHACLRLALCADCCVRVGAALRSWHRRQVLRLCRGGGARPTYCCASLLYLSAVGGALSLTRAHPRSPSCRLCWMRCVA